jgi:hypothetical protein
MVHKPDLQCHRTSCPLNISCGSAHKGHVLAANMAGNEEQGQPVTKSTDGLSEII